MNTSISDDILGIKGPKPDANGKKPGEEGYIAPESDQNNNDEKADANGKKPGEEGYVAPKDEKNDNEPVLDVNGKKPGEEGYIAPAKKPAAAAPTGDDDIDDAKLLAFLQKKNPNIKSLKDVLSPEKELSEEEKKAALEEKRSQMVVYGIKAGAIKSAAEYNHFIIDTARPAREIAFEAYKAAALAEDADADEAEIEKDFADENFEHLAEDDKKRMRAAKNMEATKNAFLNHKYSKIINLEEEYDEVMQEEADKVTYVNRVDALFDKLPEELSFEISEGKKKHTYAFKIQPDVLKALREQYKGPEYFTLFNQSSVKDEDLSATMIESLQKNQFKNIIQEIAGAHAKALLDVQAKGRRGDRPDRDEAGEGSAVGGGGISDQIIESQNKN